MDERELAEVAEQQQYFDAVEAPSSEQDEGTREMGPLYPFLISGGTNTERYYFIHINDTTDYKFNIRPKYFGNEASYPEIFPERIKDIIKNNAGAKVFCVFDLDTVFCNKTKQEKHKAFVEDIKEEIDNGTVVLCPSMPSIEYWFLLHFVDTTNLMKNYREVSEVLAPYIKPCFTDSSKNLKKLLKKEKYLTDSTWVKNLCSDGKLDTAIKWAEENIKAAIKADDIENQSYSYVYKVFK